MVEWHLNHVRHGNKPWKVQEAAAEARIASGRAKFGYWLEQGLGKTALTLNDFILAEDCNLGIVVCPNSFKGDWVIAPEEWGVDWIGANMWPNVAIDGIVPFKYLFVINYESARRGFDSYKMLEAAMKRQNVFLVVDESSFIKNHTSEQSLSVRDLAKLARHVRLLNGTPQTQSVRDWYPQLRCLGECNGMEPTVFRNRYGKKGGYMGRQIVGINEERAEELAGIIATCSFRALKAEWRPELPPQIDCPVHLEMNPVQRQHYDEMMEEFFTMVDDLEVPARMVLTQMDKLRQISSCLAMHKGEIRTIGKPKDNPKLQALKDLIESGTGKWIVVYHYKASGQLLQAELDKYKPRILTGQMTPGDLMHEKAMFNEETDYRGIICQESAACMGHTLIGGEGDDRCTRMFFYENSFSLRDRLQMRDRNHRGEQDQTCLYYDFITSPMERKVVDALIRKHTQAQMIDDVVKAVKERKGKNT